MIDLTVVGVCSYAPAVHRWLRTLRQHFDGRCLLYLTDPPPGVAEELRVTYGIEVLTVTNAADFWTRPSRGMYCQQWTCVLDASTRTGGEGFVLRTDVWDVVFQDDPRKYVPPECAKFLVSHEGMSIGEEPFNREWVGPWSRFFASAPVINAGMVCAPAKSLAVLASLILKVALDTKADQAEFELIANAFAPAFEYRHGFMECIYQQFQFRGVVQGDKFCERATGRPWCVVHANGQASKEVLDSVYPP